MLHLLETTRGTDAVARKLGHLEHTPSNVVVVEAHVRPAD
jgi:hypothetical protein